MGRGSHRIPNAFSSRHGAKIGEITRNFPSSIAPADLVRPYAREPQETSPHRLRAVRDTWPRKADALLPEDISIVRELFGTDFLMLRHLFQQAQLAEDL